MDPKFFLYRKLLKKIKLKLYTKTSTILVLTGQGKFTYKSSFILECKFQEGRPLGKGVYKNIEAKITFEGFMNNLPNGKGKETYSDLYVYDGDFLNGKKHGKGKLIYKDKGTYEGDFVNNNIYLGQK